MVVIKTTKDINQKGQKATLDQLNKNVEKLTKVLEDKQLPSTANKKNTLVNKIEEERKKREEKRIRAEDRKLREQDLKEIKQAIKDTIPADTKRDILSTGIGSFTGINPVLVKTFGLDNLAKAIVNTAIDKVSTHTKSRREERLEAEASNKTNQSSLSNTTENQNKTAKLKNQAAGNAIATDKSDSAVEQNKQQNNPTNKLLASIFGWLKKWKQNDTKEKKEEEKESWLKKLLKAGILALALGGVLKVLGGAGKVIKEAMDSFFANTLGLGIAGGVISDMLPGALLGAKFGGLQGALIGGTVSLAYFSIKRVVDDYKNRKELAKEGIYTEAASLYGMSANTYAGMVLGGIAGFMIAGPIGAIAGGLIGAGGGWIWDKVLDSKIRAQINSADADKTLEGTGTKEESVKKEAHTAQIRADTLLKQAQNSDIYNNKEKRVVFKQNAVTFLKQYYPEVNWDKYDNPNRLIMAIQQVKENARQINENATSVVGQQWKEAQLDNDENTLSQEEIKNYRKNMFWPWLQRQVGTNSWNRYQAWHDAAKKAGGNIDKYQALQESFSGAYKEETNFIAKANNIPQYLETNKISPEEAARNEKRNAEVVENTKKTADNIEQLVKLQKQQMENSVGNEKEFTSTVNGTSINNVTQNTNEQNKEATKGVAAATVSPTVSPSKF